MAKPFSIDFARPSFARGIARAPLFNWLVLAAGIALGIAAAVTLFKLAEQRNRLDTEIETELHAARVTRAARPVPKPVAIPEAQAKAVNQAIAQLNLPWSDVFDAVEAATSPTIALLSLEPDARKRRLNGIAESRSSEGMIAYIEDLKRQAFFTTVVLTRHEINEQDPNKPLRFHFEAQWVEEGV
jgi:Tfp pilus assembly protein PilN